MHPAYALPRRRITQLLALCGLLPFALRVRPARAQDAGFELISAAESLREQQALAERGELGQLAPPARTRGFGSLPAIRVLSPQLEGKPIRSPLRIELQFVAAAEARLDLNSFRVLYGLFHVDVTDKIRGNASVTDKGVVAENAKIPAGEHRLLLRISDEQGRTAETELRFQVQS